MYSMSPDRFTPDDRSDAFIPSPAGVDASMRQNVFIGVDIGGTNLRAALVDGSGTILESTRTQIRIDLGARAALDTLAAQCLILVHSAQSRGLTPRAVGLGVAGKIDKVSNSVVFSPNLPAMRNYPLGSELCARIGIPVFMENDANCFGLGESFAGTARGIANWAGITLGTGTGGCLFLDGRLWEGDGLGFSAEIGHMIILPGGPPCPCGCRGCLEAFASARALVRGAREYIDRGDVREGQLSDLAGNGQLSAENIHACARRGDAIAISLFEKVGWALGIAVANVFSMLGIRHAVLGGGVSAAWDLFSGSLRSSLSANLSMLDPELAIVQRGALGDNAALLGAARLASMASDPRK